MKFECAQGRLRGGSCWPEANWTVSVSQLVARSELWPLPLTGGCRDAFIKSSRGRHWETQTLWGGCKPTSKSHLP